MILFRSASVSHSGMVRSVNQDTAFESMVLCAVADGMGGAAAGDVASRIAIETLVKDFSTGSPTVEALQRGIETANSAVYLASLNDISYAGMGTTLTAMAPVAGPEGDRVAIAHVGDSRCYLFANGQLRQLTNDHSVASELVRHGELTPAAAARHPQRHMLTRALGVDPNVDVEILLLPLAAGDRLLLCSDGLSNEVTAERISAILGIEPDPTLAANALVSEANEHGARDNVTVLLVDVLVGDEGAETRDLDALAPIATDVPLVEDVNDLTGSVPAFGAMAAGGALATTIVDAVGNDANSQVPTPAGAEREAKHRAAVAAATASGSAVEASIRRPRLITLRTLAFLLLVVGLAYGGYRFVGWFATTQYFVSTDGTHLTILQGQPGGTLWVSPVLVETTSTTTKQILQSRLRDIQSGVPEPSLKAAHSFIANLKEEYQAAINPGASLPTTTTTYAWVPQTFATTTVPTSTISTVATTTTIPTTIATTVPTTTVPTTVPVG